MPSFKRSIINSLRRGYLLRGIVLAAGAAGLVIVLTGIAVAAIVVRRPGPPLPVMLTDPYARRPIVWVAPPMPRVVVVPGPRAGWVWAPGYWRWTAGAYVWIDGAWLAARPGSTYAPAHWDRFPGGWQFVPSGWIRRPL